MKLLPGILIILMALVPLALAEEVAKTEAEESVKVEVAEPSDPITDIITAPFKIIGAIFSGGKEGVAYDPDQYRAYWSSYEPWYYGEDPYYFGRYDTYHPYRGYHFDPFRHYRGRYYYHNPC